MATLELKAPKNKEVNVVVIEAEHSVPWSFNAIPGKLPPNYSSRRCRPSTGILWSISRTSGQPDVICEELGLRTAEEFQYDNFFTEEFQR